MSKYSVNDTTLIGIADAIRAKDGSAGSILVPDIASRILALSGSADISSGTWAIPAGARYNRLNVGIDLSEEDVFLAICTGDNDKVIEISNAYYYFYPLAVFKSKDYAFGTALYTKSSAYQVECYDNTSTNFNVTLSSTIISITWPYDTDRMNMTWYLLRGV